MAYNKVVYNGGTLIDLTGDTVTESDVAEGKVFHLANGETSMGTLKISDNIVTEYKSVSGKSVSGNSTAEFQINVAKAGYIPLGIVGRYVGYAPFSFIRESITGNTASVTLRNISSSSTNSGTVGVYVLYVKE